MTMRIPADEATSKIRKSDSRADGAASGSGDGDLRSLAGEIAPGQLFIGGRWQPAGGGETRENVNPATGGVTTTVAVATQEDTQEAIAAARKAIDEGPWPAMDVGERARVLRRVGELMYEHADEIAVREVVDVGKPVTTTRAFDVPQAAELFLYYSSLVESDGGASRPGIGRSMFYTRPEPLGVIGAITPFNFPLNLSVNKLAPALAAGNAVVHKPAGETPLSALRLPDIFSEAGVPEGVYNLVTGSGRVVGGELIASPDVDKIGFTGSTNVGINTQTQAAATLKHVTLELGGKNALVVFADADLDALTETIFRAGFFNCGQFCMGCSRVLVERSVHGELVERLVARVEAARVGDPLDADTEVGPLAHKEQYDKVRQYVGIGQQEGATLRTGGNPLSVNGDGGFFHELTVFDDVNPGMRIAQEEIFGPVLSIIPFDTEDEALGIANGLDYGLSAGVATGDLKRAHRVAHALEAGIVWVNSWAQFTSASPFGGYKHSGYGRELGPEGLAEYRQLKTVYLELN